MLLRTLLCLAAFVTMAQAAEEYTWWIDPCTPAAAESTGCHAGDEQLGQWALEAWQRDATGALSFRKSASEEHARIRIHWAGGASNLYGETQPAIIDGKRGANIYVLPDVRFLGADIANAALHDLVLREAIVYLTCVHESGHALGLSHTANFADIMYSFQYGGDIVGYFQRYRGQLKTRDDIRAHAGTSPADLTALRAALVTH